MFKSQQEMNKSMEYVQDGGGVFWRINLEEGFAEYFPASFDDWGSNPDAIKYNGSIDNYLRNLGEIDTKYIVSQDRWIFKLFIK